MACCFKSSARDEVSIPVRTEPNTKTVHYVIHEGAAFLRYSSENGKNLWDQTWGKLNDAFGKGKNFQLIYPFMDWTWNYPNPGYIDAIAYTVADQMPAWSAIGSYEPSATSLYSAYTSMLRQCPKLLPTPEQQQQLKEILEQIRSAQGILTSDTAAMKYDYVQARKVPEGVPPPEYEKWLVSSGWQKRLAGDAEVVDKLTTTQAEILAQQNPEYKVAIDASTLPTDDFDTKPGFARCDVMSNVSWRANYIIGTTGQDWKAQLSSGGNSFSLSAEASQNSHSMQQSWAGGAGGYGRFFGIYANGSWHDMDLSESDSSVKVEINIQAVATVPIRPDPNWFNSGYLKILASNEQWNQPYTTKGGAHPVFGEGGLMPLMITGMVVGYKPSFKITMHSSTFHRYQSQLETSGGVRIGPFHIGGTYKRTTDNWNKEVKDDTFSGKSTADYPFILGFTVAEPGLS